MVEVNWQGEHAPGEEFLHAQKLTGTPSNEEIIEEYLKQRSLSIAASSLETYSVSAHNFLRAINHKNFCDLKQKDIREWQQSQRFLALSKSTQHLESGVVDHFLKWLGKAVGYGGPGEKVSVTIPKVKQDRQTRSEEIQERIVTPKEFEALLEAATYARDKALIAFLCDTGLRASECLALNKEDVFMGATPAYVKVKHGKGAKRRTVPFTQETADMLGRYLSSINYEHRELEDPIWLSIRGGDRLQYLGLRDMLRKVSKKAGLSRYVKPHDLRHTAATRDVKSGKISTSVLQAKYGWSDIKQADVYTHLNGDDINAAYAEAWDETADTKTSAASKPLEYTRCKKCGTPLLPGDACPECAKQAELRPLREEVETLKKQVEGLQGWKDEVDALYELLAKMYEQKSVMPLIAAYERGKKMVKEQKKEKDKWLVGMDDPIPDIE